MGKSTSTTPVDLGLRLQPQQQRAQQSIELILASAATLLDEAGLDAFNTNLLAKHAGIRVRTIYRYFPNKFAILAELARRNTMRVIEVAEGFSPLADVEISLQQGLDIFWSNYQSKIAKLPGVASVRHACRVYPELESIRHQFHATLSKQFETAIMKRGIKLQPAKRRLVSALFIETTNAILDYAESLEPKRKLDLIKELQLMQHRYLVPYF